jgi:uncharacterized protein (TIGR03437 family)
MRVKLTSALAAAVFLPALAAAAPFGTVVQVHGSVADIAANFSAYRVEVITPGNATLVTSIPTTAPPSAVAVSPDAHYLVIGLYQSPATAVLGGFLPNTGGLEIIDLTTGALVQSIALPNPVLSVTFGNDGNALVAVSISTTSPPPPNVFLLNPSTGNLQALWPYPFYSVILPQNPSQGEANVLTAMAPAQIIQTSAAASADGSVITILGAGTQDNTATSTGSVLMRYTVATQTLNGYGFTTTPPMGPRSVASDATGANVISGWALNRFLSNATCLQNPPPALAYPGPCEWAQVGSPNGAFQLGSHAWDVTRNLIYSQIPAPNEGSVLNIMAADNLTVQERLQIPETLSGKSLMSSDGNTMYSVSASGVTIFPIGQLPQTPQVGAAQEDLLFANTGNGCTVSQWTQTLNINSLGSAPADFTLTLPQGTTGVTLSQTTGTTPAQVLVTIDPAAFQTATGTTTIPLTITSNAAVNLPPAVRLLINMRGANQVGRIFNIPGKIVDLLADPARARLYVLRQDKNLVKVFDMATLTELADLRTGNTPTQMALSVDNNYLLVGNDNSMIANVFDLNALVATPPILFPYGHYPRSIGITSNNSFALMRNAGLQNPSPPCKTNTPVAVLDQIDFTNRIAYTPCTLNGATEPSIYSNDLSSFNGVIAPSGDGRFLTMELDDSTVAEYDSVPGAWVASRRDFGGLLGSYGALNDQLWNAGPNLLDAALVPVGTPFPATDGTPSGVAPFLGIGVRTSAPSATAPGIVQLIDTINYTELDPVLMAEAPVTNASLTTTPIGQIGETILEFTRSLAVSPDQTTLYALTTSGLTIIPANFTTPPTIPMISSVVSTADDASAAATGGLVTIFGTNLSGSSQTSGFPLAVSLGSACVTANGEALPLYFASPSMINAQIPYDIVGNASLVVQSTTGVSNPFSLQVQSVAPAIFLNTTASPGTSIPFITRLANGLLLTPSNPVHPGDALQIYLAGMGQTTPPATAGVATPSTPVETVLVAPTVTVGGVNAQVTQATLTPGVAGVYTVDVSVSLQTPLGLSVPLTISQGGISQTVPVRVVK